MLGKKEVPEQKEVRSVNTIRGSKIKVVSNPFPPFLEVGRRRRCEKISYHQDSSEIQEKKVAFKTIGLLEMHNESSVAENVE